MLGTLNFIDDAPSGPRAAALVRRGRSFSLSQPFDMNGPQKGWRRRTNPVHTMLDTGTDAAARQPGLPARHRRRRRRDRDAAAVLHPVGRPRPHLRPRHGLERPAGRATSSRATATSSRASSTRHPPSSAAACCSTGSVPAHLAPDERGELPDGYAITDGRPRGRHRRAGRDERRRPRRHRARAHRALARARREGWGDYAGGPAPGLSFTTAGWLHRTEIAAIATDTWGFEVRPNEFDERLPAAAPGRHPEHRA